MAAGTGIAAAIETKPLFESAVVAIAAGVGVTAFFALGLLGTIKYAELRRQERPMLSALFGVVGVVALAAATAMIAYGLIVVA